MKKHTKRYGLLLMAAFLLYAAWVVGLAATAQDSAQTADGYIMEKAAQALTLRIPGEESRMVLAIPESLLQSTAIQAAQVGDRVTVTYGTDSGGIHILRTLEPGVFERIRGDIAEVFEGGILITPYEGNPVIAHVGEGVITGGLNELCSGMPVTVSYSGVMTRSIPGQITAEAVVVPTLTGVIQGIGENRLTLLEDTMGEVIVHLSEETVLSEGYAPKEGDRVLVVSNGIMAMSLPPQVSALFLFPAVNAE